MILLMIIFSQGKAAYFLADRHQFQDAYDEFPVQCSVLFDAGVSYHLATATLYVLGIMITEKFKEEYDV